MQQLERFLHEMCITYTQEGIRSVEVYMKLFFEWNAVHHLSSIKKDHDFLMYCRDSLFPMTFIKKVSTVLDVGAGAGFPGLLLAIFLPQTQVILVEPNKKKAAFLEVAILEMGLKNVSVIKKRIQEIERCQVDMVTSRALCCIKDFLPLLSLVSYQNLLLYKGQNVSNELDALKEGSNSFQIHEFGKMKYLYKEKGYV